MINAKMLREHCLPSVAVLATSGLPIVAEAQSVPAVRADNDSEFVTEVVVTAQRRSQKLQDVGIAITAATADQLRQRSIVQSQDVAKISPGVLFEQTSGGGISTVLTIRGVSQSDTTAHQEAPNSVYVDDVYLFSVGATSFPLFDLDRVEVLRGPQGTLFGRSSSGGLIHYITARPTQDWGGFVDVGYGRYDSIYGEAAVGGPLAENVRIRLSGRGERHDGWFNNRNPGGKDSFAGEAFGLRGQLEADLTDELTARFQIEYDKSPRHAEGTYKPENFYYDADGLPTPLPAGLDAYGTGLGNDLNGYRDPYRDKQTGAFNNRGFYENDRVLPSLYVNWQRDDLTVTSVTNYTKFRLGYDEDCDGTPLDYCSFLQGSEVKQYSQELRANGRVGQWTYTGGGYYLHIDSDNYTRYSSPSSADSNFAFDGLNRYDQRSSTHSLFGQLEYEFDARWKATLGARWTHENKVFDSQFFLIEAGDPEAGPDDPQSILYDPPLLGYDFSTSTVGGLAQTSVDMWSGKIALDHKVTPDHLLFASASRGIKGPGFNSNIAGLVSMEQTPFHGEVLYAYEIGSKNRLVDGRLTLDASAFNYDYRAFQAFAFTGLQGIVSNYDARIYGIELETAASLPGRITLNLTGAYLQTQVKDVATAYSGIRDQDSIQAPRWTANGNISKTLSLGDSDLTLSWTFNYVSDRYASVDNNRANYLKGAFVHNARISYQRNDIEVSAFVNNISDVDKEVFVYDYVSFTGSVIKSYDRPRWWGVAIRKNF